MEQVSKVLWKKTLLLFLLMAFSTFEYFFRSNVPMLLLAVYAMLLFIKQNGKVDRNFLMIFLIFSILFFVQVCFLQNYSLLGMLGRLFYIFSYFAIAYIVGSDFKCCYLRIMAMITIYSIGIYLLAQIPVINDYLVNVVCPRFPSLNQQAAIQEGGGINFVIYNFQFNAAGYELFWGSKFRNSGPFFEPGMFAIYLNIALFFNLFFNKNNTILTILFVSGLLTTFSTGGYVGLLVIMLCYVFFKKKGGIYKNIILLIVLVCAVFYLSQVDFIGLKLFNQLNEAELGGEGSRFGALLTQLLMIRDSPLIGGMEISDYTHEDTLASGLFFPVVSFGIPVGVLYYVLLLKSCLVFALNERVSRNVGICLFITILVLSISQTILLMPLIYVLIFLPFVKMKKNGTV